MKLAYQLHPKMKCIHTILERQVELIPDLPALKSGEHEINYQRFNAVVNQFSHYLIGIGVHGNVCVGLAMERSFEMVIAIFAILKAGGAYVPVDPAYPDDRIQFIFREASVNILVTQKKFTEKFEKFPQQLLYPDISSWAYNDFPTSNPSINITPNNLAYILFTSGSTGKPKGVMVEHHSVANLISCIQRLYPIAGRDMVLLKSPYTFDGSVWELYGWLIPGGSLYISAPGIEKDPALLLKTLISNEISFTFFVSSMLSAFLEYVEMSGNEIVTPKLKWVSVGGEVVSPSLVKRFYKVFGASRTGLFNVYGPTETTVYATTYLCRIEDNEKTPVGMAVDHDFIYVLDESMNQVAPTMEGEIFIGGEGVARGYLNRPELDAQKFLPDPFRTGGKMYATGDIGRFLPDGNLDFIGRHDFQIKMRGLRIELGEIENALLAVPGIRDAVVVFTKDRFNDDSLIAFLVPDPDSGITAGEGFMLARSSDKDRIIGTLQNSLPDFMIPSEIVICSIFPVTENGKLDREALKLPKVIANGPSNNFVPPSTPEEIWLAEIWQEVLTMEKISVNDSFFKLGGHSLKAVRIAARIAAKSGIGMPIKTIFDNPTIQKLAKILHDQVQVEPSRLSGILHVERHNNGYPLNANQLELWFLHKMDVTRTQHNILFRLDIQGEPEIGVFQAAVNALIVANESLMTVIMIRDGVPLQFLREPYEIGIPATNLHGLEQSEKELRLDKAGKSIGQQFFNLETGGLFSFDWFMVSEQRHVVFFCIHHIIFDGWSMFNFFNGLKQAYLNIHSKLPIELQKLEIQNIDFAVHEQDNSNRAKLNGQLEYWKTVYSNLPPQLILHCRKPFDLNKVAQSGKRLWWKIPMDEVAALKTLTVAHSCSLFSLLLSVYKIMLCNFSGNPDIVVGTPYANRCRWEIEPLIGYFTNMMALRSRISGDLAFSSFVKNVQRTSLDAFANADLPFGQLIRSLGLITSPGNYPLFQNVFVLQNWAMPDMEFAGLTLAQKELGSGGIKAELMLNVEETGNELECWLEYDLSLYEEPSVKKMVSFINETIRAIVDDPEISLGKLLSDSRQIFSEERERPTCLLIGETGLLTECGELLLHNGFSPTGLISPDPACIAWGKINGIGLITGYEGIKSTDWNIVKYDYIFSIANGKILKKDMLERAAKGCINYHDSLLPTYAGVHATSWALLMGEVEHGVSWHIMTEDTDAGGAIASAKVAIADEDTAFALNAKCFEAAILSFKKVIDTILNNAELPAVSVKPISYFGLYQKPFASAILDFRQPSRALNNMIRALYFGENIGNTLASPKLLTTNGVFIVQHSVVSVRQINQKPSTLLKLSDQGAVIATLDGTLTITAITTLCGGQVSASTAFDDIAVGAELPAPTPGQLLFIDQQIRINAPNERFWIKQLSLVSNSTEPVPPSQISKRETTDIPVSGNNGSDLRATLIFFLACYSNSTSFTVGLGNDNTYRVNSESSGILADVLPFIIPPIAGLTCEKALTEIDREVANIFSKGTYLFDIVARTPELKRKFAGTEKPRYSFILTTSTESGYSIFEGYHGSTIFIPGADCITVISNDATLIEDCACRIPIFFQQISDHLHDAAASVNMLTALELGLYDRINEQWDLTKVKPFLQLFDNQVENDGGKIAIEFENCKSTYRELSNRSWQVAGFIAENITGSDENIIGICLHRNPDFITYMLGVLRSGKAYLPIDPEMPKERIKTILLSSGVSCVFSAEGYRENLPGHVKMFDTGNIFDRQIESPGFKIQNIEGNQPAYVIYTSGTTGKPKGVVIQHRSLNVFINGSASRYSLSSTDRVLQFASLAFDASVEEIFPTLACGATLVMRTNDSITGINRFLDFCQEKAISVLDLPTAFWHQLMENSIGSAWVPAKLRLVIIGGERARNSHLAKWLDSPWNDVVLYNTYGPTETTVVATAYELPKRGDVRCLPIGKPVFGAKARIRNVFGQTGIPSRPNELLIGGDIVSSGYLHQDDLTATKFSPINEGAEEIRFYATGDLVTILPDGNMVFAGRTDEQLKIRGFRVEISEIESAINQLPGVLNCLIVPVSHEGKETALTAYVVLHHGQKASKIEDLLRLALPGYMIPSHFMEIPFIPLTINNKPDLKALPGPVMIDKSIPNADQPATEMEKIVFSVWEMKLGTSNFGVNNDFFKLGGHSLMALAVMGELEKLTGKTIPLASLFSFPTVKTLASAIDQEKESEGWRPLVCIKPGTGPIPLFIIHGGGLNVLLFNTLAQKMAPDQPVYGIQAHGLDGISAPYDHIDDIASHYMREIRSVMPHGPYSLAGFSIGGLIAHELCCRFAEQNEPVAFLGMFDTAAVSSDKDLPMFKRMFLRARETMLHLGFNIRLILTDPVNTMPKKMKWFKYRVKMKFLDQDAANREDLIDLPSNLIYIAKANIKAISAMKLRTFPGTLHLFRAVNRNFYVSDPVFLGWKEYAAKVVVHPIPGGHNRIFAPPNDTVFAEKLQQALDGPVSGKIK